MAWVVDDVMLVEVKQTYLEQTIVNTLFYKIIDIVGTAITNALLDLLAEALVDFLTPAQNDDVDHIEQIMTNLTDDISQHIATYQSQGDIASSEPVASFLAVGMKKAVSSRLTRPGSIRIAGQNEAHLIGNSLTGPYITICEGVGVDLAGTVIINDQAGTVATFNPVIVGRDEVGAFDLLRVNDISSVALPRLTTQNSRKPER